MKPKWEEERKDYVENRMREILASTESAKVAGLDLSDPKQQVLSRIGLELEWYDRKIEELEWTLAQNLEILERLRNEGKASTQSEGRRLAEEAQELGTQDA